MPRGLMNQPRNKSTIDIAASQLRTLVLSVDENTLLGSEEDLINQLGVSRATVRQVARLLEREGLLRVKRGINGGYFALRPDVSTIAETVSTYLDMVDTEREDITQIASVLWIEVVRKAAVQCKPEAKILAEKLTDKLQSLSAEATFENVRDMEQEIRSAIFDLINSHYTELIFRINMAYASRHFRSASETDETDEHHRFVHDWRNAKVMELSAISDGDPILAVIAARHSRNLWHQRLWGRPPA